MAKLEGVAIIDDVVAIGFEESLVQVQMTSNDMRRFAVDLLLAADRVDGVESPPVAKLMGARVDGSA